MVKGATNKRRSEGPFARAHLGLDGGRGDDARVGADGLRHGSTTACHLTLGSPEKKMTTIVSLQNVGSNYDSLQFSNQLTISTILRSRYE